MRQRWAVIYNFFSSGILWHAEHRGLSSKFKARGQYESTLHNRLTGFCFWCTVRCTVIDLRTNVKMLDSASNMELNNVGSNKSSVYLVLSFRRLCLATVGLPLVSLLFCFVTAYIFQQDDIHETHCRVSKLWCHCDRWCFIDDIHICLFVKGL